MTEINDHKTFWKRSTMEIITYTEGSLADIIQLARKDILSLITTIESLQGDMEAAEIAIKSYREEVESQKEEIENLKQFHEGYSEVSIRIESQLRDQIESLKAIVKLAVNGLKEIKWDADKAEFISLNGANNFKEFISDKIQSKLSEIEMLSQ